MRARQLDASALACVCVSATQVVQASLGRCRAQEVGRGAGWRLCLVPVLSGSVRAIGATMLSARKDGGLRRVFLSVGLCVAGRFDFDER